MKRSMIFICCLCAIGGSTFAGPRTSANYSIATDTTDAGGKRVASATYTNDSSIGGLAGLSNVAAPAETAKHGYIGQLYEIVALSITASSNNLNETASRQLNAAPMADDATTLAVLDPSTVSWSIVSGPLTAISLSGIATAGNVYQDTAASAGGAAQSLGGQLNLTILNVGTDDFGTYAGDQIDDSWQVQYFGLPPNPLAGPNADADGTGQTNLFKFVAGLNPLDGSRFTLSIQQVSGQPARKNLIFQPLVSGRTYTPQFRTDLTTGSWNTLTGTTQSDNGDIRTVTDTSAAAPKYYRVQISRP